MEQKIMWFRYLIIGVSILFLNITCGEDLVEPISTDTYTYKNESGKNVVLKIYNTVANSSEENTIINGESKSFTYIGYPGTAPFYSNDESQMTANLVVLQFEDNKCLSFERDFSNGGGTAHQGDGIFNVDKYDVYDDSDGKLSKHFYYTISVDLYNQAQDCN